MDKFKKLFTGIGTVAVLAMATEKLQAQDKDILTTSQETSTPKVESNQNVDTSLGVVGSHERLDSIYNQEKEANDQGFGGNLIIEGLPEGTMLGINYSLNSSSAVLMKRDANGELISREEFSNLDTLKKVYPINEEDIRNQIEAAYKKYKDNFSWKKILDEKRATLANNFEDYQPTQEELDILKAAVAKRNGGGVSDGFDEMYHFYKALTKTPEGEYLFYIKYGGTPSYLATYMTDKYYKPFIK